MAALPPRSPPQPQFPRVLRARPRRRRFLAYVSFFPTAAAPIKTKTSQQTNPCEAKANRVWIDRTLLLIRRQRGISCCPTNFEARCGGGSSSGRSSPVMAAAAEEAVTARGCTGGGPAATTSRFAAACGALSRYVRKAETERALSAPLRPAPPAPILCCAAGSRHALHRRIPCRPGELQRLLPNSSRLRPPPSILWSGQAGA